MRKILIVEQDSEMRNTLSMILQVADYEVDILPAGQRIDSSNVSAYDIVICDMANPQHDQKQVLDTLNTITTQMPVVIISEFGHESSLNGLVENPGIGILQKPFKSKELLTMVESLQRDPHSCPVELLEKIA